MLFTDLRLFQAQKHPDEEKIWSCYRIAISKTLKIISCFFGICLISTVTLYNIQGLPDEIHVKDMVLQCIITKL